METLGCYEISEEYLNELVKKYDEFIKITNNKEDYIHGWDDIKYTIYYNREKSELAIREYYLTNKYDHPSKLVICHLNKSLKTNYEKTIAPTTANILMWKKIYKYYSKEEAHNLLDKYSAEEISDLKQIHYLANLEINELKKYKNCYYYDINGAHLDALCEIFPKCKDDFIKIFNSRHKNRNNKLIPNYFVGMLARQGHRKTYNWIVQRTTKILSEAIIKCKGYLIYANTDGFIVSHPEKLISPSKSLGQFKAELENDDVYLYQGSNYFLIQYKDEKKGNAPYLVRDYINLPTNDVVKFTMDKSKKYLEIKNLERIHLCQEEEKKVQD